MSQSGYELMKAAIHRGRPERLPNCFDVFGVSDRAWLPIGRPEGFEPVAPGADEWGCIWGRTAMKNMGQIVGHPFEQGIPADLASTPYPDYDNDSRYAQLPAALDQAEAEGKYASAGLFMVLFERIHGLMGFENAMCALADEDEHPDLARLIDHIVSVHLRYIDNLDQRFPGRIHSINMSDDWGTQQAAYVSADFWMEFFHPHYKRLFDRMHAAGYDVWVHSCGKVNEIVECYISAGVDVVNLQQPRALGIEEIGRRYRGRICFETLCDIQHTLPKGDQQQIEADVRDLMRHWADRDGGLIFADYGNGEAIGASIESKRCMYEAFSRASQELYGNPLPIIQ